MSRKSRERRERHRPVRADEYFSNGIFEIARYGANTLMKSHRTPEQQQALMAYLREEYPAKYEAISQQTKTLREKAIQCDPYGLLMYFRQKALIFQINVFSESEYERDANALMRVQEYVQSILVSTDGAYKCNTLGEGQDALYEQIADNFKQLYIDLQVFYIFWAAHTQEATEIDDEHLNILVESQYMYWVRGNRYQIFELEPLKRLLPPHDAVLRELFGVSAADIIGGLEKLRYSLSQAFADAGMELDREYRSFSVAVITGVPPEEALKNQSQQARALLDKLFGSDLIDVMAVTGWDRRLIEALTYRLGECKTFWGEEPFAGWPIVEQPIIRKPFIEIDYTAYAFLYYALFDNIYRNLQKSIMRQKPEYSATWKDKQTSASEEMVAELFCDLLSGAMVHIGNYYPVHNSLKQMNENDIIVLYLNRLFIIEVKSGSFPTTPPLTDFQAHISAYQKLVEAADSQCSRTLSYISRCVPAQFYNHDKNATFSLPDLSTFDAIFTFSVTVDSFNDFAARAEKMNVISLKEKTIVISYDDLLAYKGYFSSPISFLHYLKQRQAAISVPQYQINDELDHLGLYIERNLYAQSPSQFDVQRVMPVGFRRDLDEYFGLLFVDPSKAKKPTQAIPKRLSEIIQYWDSNISLENIRLGHWLLDLSGDTREDLSQQIDYALRRQREIGRMIPMLAIGEVKYCVFVKMPGILSYTDDEQLDYTYAAASRNVSIPVLWISLEYNDQDALISARGRVCAFSDLKGDDIQRIKTLGEQKAKDWVKLYKQIHKKIGRNEICLCGSGKKYKFCCLENE